jgi:hypothetical protein
MLEGSSRDGRMNFQTAVTQLILANYAPRDARGNIQPFTSKKEEMDFINAKMAQIDMNEITQGYLWFSATLQPARQVIQFTVVDTQQVNGSPITPMNRLLTMQDSFLISNLGYFLQQFQYPVDQPNVPDFSVGSNWEPITYTAAWYNNGSAQTLDPGLGMMWMGAYLTLTVNKKVIIPAWDCLQHYVAPVAQYTPTIVQPSAYIPNQKSSMDCSTDGLVYVQPNVVIGGGRGNDLRLTLPANIPDTIAPFNTDYYNSTIVMTANVVVRGILMQNSTNIK